MSLFDCIQRLMDDPEIKGNKARGKKAQDRFKQIYAGLTAEGEPDHVAAALAGERVKAEVAFENAKKRHRTLAAANMQMRMQREVATVKDKDLRWLATEKMDRIDFNARAISSRAHGMINRFLREHRTDILSRNRDQIGLENVMRERHGQATGNEMARTLSEGIGEAFEYLRTAMNEAGHLIPKLENFGIPHSWNRSLVVKADPEKFVADLAPRMNWRAVVNNKTGRAFQTEGGPPPSQAFQRDFLLNVYDNIKYGRKSKTATYGEALGNGDSLDAHRVLHFKTADDWIAVNKLYGASDPFSAVVTHIDFMAREVAMAREFGPNREAGLDYLRQLTVKEARTRQMSAHDAWGVSSSGTWAKGMMNALSGGVQPSGPWTAKSAAFFSTTRSVLRSALLDRAVIISVPSDLNSARLAAQAVAMKPDNVLSAYTTYIKDGFANGSITKDDLLRMEWVADGWGNPAVTAQRFQQDFPAQEWAQKMSNAVMRAQGLALHTDSLKQAMQEGFAGHFASHRMTAMEKLPEGFRDSLQAAGITPYEWDVFRNGGGEFTATNGAVFLDPIWWHKTTEIDPKIANEIFIKFQSYVEEWTERAVPTQSLYVNGAISPTAWGLVPGTPLYEVAQSLTMFKGIVGAVMVNMGRQAALRRGGWNKFLLAADYLTTATLAGAVAIQVGDLLMGRDPQDMTDPAFWGRSLLKGGALGPVGDIVTTGTASWGGGLASYVAGPVAQLLDDSMKLSLGNAADAAGDILRGESADTGFIKEGVGFVKRYLPGGQSPVLLGGAAFDRIMADQFQIALDPESADDLLRAAEKRAENYGSGTFWLPGQMAPGRAPNLGNAFGQ